MFASSGITLLQIPLVLFISIYVLSYLKARFEPLPVRLYQLISNMELVDSFSLQRLRNMPGISYYMKNILAKNVKLTVAIM